MKRKGIQKFFQYVLISVGGLIMIYPLIWLFFSSFKSNKEIFGNTGLLPQVFLTDGYVNGWKVGNLTFTTFFLNTFKLVIPTVLFTVFSCALVAYGFARFQFPGKRVLFLIVISTMMLPNAVLIIPRYLLFRDFGWLNSYLPFFAPAALACYPFFIYMMIQFLRGVPKELDEAAKIDGCGSFVILMRILLPILKPALFSAGLFQMMWTWNDFYNPLIYITSIDRYPLSLALRMTLDVSAGVEWNRILAMSLVSIVPLIVVFFFSQRYFVEGVTAGGVKG